MGVRLGGVRGGMTGRSRLADDDLHQRQLRPPGAFAHEFGIQPDPWRQGVEAGREFGGIADPMHG